MREVYEMAIHILIRMDKETKFIVLGDHCFISHKQKELSED